MGAKKQIIFIKLILKFDVTRIMYSIYICISLHQFDEMGTF